MQLISYNYKSTILYLITETSSFKSLRIVVVYVDTSITPSDWKDPQSELTSISLQEA